MFGLQGFPSSLCPFACEHTLDGKMINEDSDDAIALGGQDAFQLRNESYGTGFDLIHGHRSFLLHLDFCLLIATR